MAVYCFTQLIQPGKREEANAEYNALKGSNPQLAAMLDEKMKGQK